ncbi:MAG: SET domain-containing protein [Candidatus Paceibacterota bacterium]
MIKNKKKKSSSSVKISIKRSRTGLGLFAMEQIEKGSFIVEYTGKLISKAEEEKKNNARYLFEINSKKTLDGSPRSNIARYINHSCSPNAEPQIKKGKILIYARKKIKAGEEITYDYGREYWKEFIQPKGCLCAKCLKKSKLKK